MEKSVKFNSSTDAGFANGIVIGKTVTIENGIIDGNNKARISKEQLMVIPYWKIWNCKKENLVIVVQYIMMMVMLMHLLTSLTTLQIMVEPYLIILDF